MIIRYALPSLSPSMRIGAGRCVGTVVSVSRLRFSTAADETRRSNLPDVLQNYPMILSPHQRNADRLRYFEPPFPDWWPWFERMILNQFRRHVARSVTKSFINRRFDSPDSTSEYFPTHFLIGAATVPPALARALSNWDGTDVSRLEGIATPQVASLFARAHSALSKEGYSLELEVKNVDDAKAGDVWITFGNDKDTRGGTLTPSRVEEVFAPFIFQRRATGSGKAMFREATLEYCVDTGDSADEPLNFAQKKVQLDRGQVIGVDIDFVLDVSAVLRTVDSKEEVWSGRGRREFGLRLDSSHFQGQFPDDGSWYVADVDYLIASERRKEEERAYDGSNE